MSISGLIGQIQTVLGPIRPDELGVTLPHEHFLIDMSVYFKEPTSPSEKSLAHQPVSLENLGWIKYHPHSNLDNLRLLEEETAIREALRYKRAGGNSVVDVTSIGLGRDPRALARISRATGLNIIMGSGYYLEDAQGFSTRKLTEETICKEIISDIAEGVSTSGVCAGIIGEIGVQWPLGDWDKKVLRAVSRAQKETGAPVNIHPGRSPESPFEIIEILENTDAELNRVIISHIERTIFDHETRLELAKKGCYLEYDLFSWEGYHPERMVVSEKDPRKADLPNDAERINQIMALIDEGLLKQILISHDHCVKYRLWSYGGPGFAHILENVVPLMRDKGMSEEHIETLLVENPGRAMTFI